MSRSTEIMQIIERLKARRELLLHKLSQLEPYKPAGMFDPRGIEGWGYLREERDRIRCRIEETDNEILRLESMA